MGKHKSKFDFNSTSILLYVIKKIKILAVISIIAAIVSGIASFMITPMFKSTVIIFPTSPASVSRSILSDGYVAYKSDFMSFGEENECDQLLQVLNSVEIKDMVNKKYNLMEHYGIDSFKTKYPKTLYYKYFEGNFSFRRSEYLSVIIDVYDKDRKLAALMANDVASLLDTLITRMQKVRALKAFEIAKKEYFEWDSTIKKYDDSLTSISKLGIYNYEYQSRELTRAYYNALIKGKTQISESIKKKLDNVSKYGRTYVALHEKTNYLRKEFLEIYTIKYIEAKAELEQKLPHKFIVESARVSEKKAYPKRSLIVLTSTISAFFFTLGLMVFVDTIKKHF